jgi:hypothetical protein
MVAFGAVAQAPACAEGRPPLRRYLDGPGRDDDLSQQEARVREGFTAAFGMLGFDQDGTFHVAIDEFAAFLVLARMNTSGSAPRDRSARFGVRPRAC